MLAKYLYQHREKRSLLSWLWLKNILKRIFMFKNLMVVSTRQKKYLLCGANIHPFSVLEKIRIEGKKSNVSIGKGSFLGKGVYIASHAVVRIGENVAINAGAKLFSASHDVNHPKWVTTKAPIIIEDNVWVASQAIILPGSKLCQGVVVGAGAVVSGTVEKNAVVVGNPARIIKYRDDIEYTYSPAAYSALCNAWLGGVKE